MTTANSTDSGRTELQRAITAYWDARSRGYSKATRISYQTEEQLIDAMSHFVNLNRHMRIADMGTAAGRMAMWLASMGHDVVGMDLSERMLEEARRNAKDAGLSIEFVKGDIQSAELEKGAFDMVVAVNSVWCLTDPYSAYERWIELLKPGGYLIISDGNFYLDLYDEEYRKRKEYLDLKNGPDNNLHAKTNEDRVDLNIIRELAKELPLSRIRRPSWDVTSLLGLGMMDIHVKSLDTFKYSVLTENGLMLLPKNFIVCAQKPYESMSPKEAAVYGEPLDEFTLDSISERIRLSGTDELVSLRALADIKRLAIIKALESGKMNVSQISRVVGISQSLVSHNLRLLKEAGIVMSRKEGKETFYRLTDAAAINTIIDMCNLMRERGDVRERE